uniref:Si:dkey-17e16.15 n=1 Tax=Latimeria chalumnae TaxID=7897 RepID=H3BBJ5_LATCH
MSREQIEVVVKTVETLLADAEQMKNRCRRQNEEVRSIMEELRRDNRELAQKYAQTERDVEEMKKTLGELMDTKIAFEARERQVRKLSKQL